MNKLTCTIFVTFAALQFAMAADDTANAPAEPGAEQAPAAAPNTPAPIDLKNKSSFVLEENSRNPFWPIGWKPQPKVNAHGNEQAAPEVTAAAFVVSSIMIGGGSRFAIINGKPMEEGQVFGLQAGSQVYQITVKSIEDGQVILLRRDQELAVPLRRR